MDRKEMETKLLKHGLPTWGTDEQMKQRLLNNGIIAAAKTIGEVHKAIEHSDAATFMHGEPKKEPPTEIEPRKMGRPKKVK